MGVSNQNNPIINTGINPVNSPSSQAPATPAKPSNIQEITVGGLTFIFYNFGKINETDQTKLASKVMEMLGNNVKLENGKFKTNFEQATITSERISLKGKADAASAEQTENVDNTAQFNELNQFINTTDKTNEVVKPTIKQITEETDKLAARSAIPTRPRSSSGPPPPPSEEPPPPFPEELLEEHLPPPDEPFEEVPPPPPSEEHLPPPDEPFEEPPPPFPEELSEEHLPPPDELTPSEEPPPPPPLEDLPPPSAEPSSSPIHATATEPPSSVHASTPEQQITQGRVASTSKRLTQSPGLYQRLVSKYNDIKTKFENLKVKIKELRRERNGKKLEKQLKSLSNSVSGLRIANVDENDYQDLREARQNLATSERQDVAQAKRELMEIDEEDSEAGNDLMILFNQEKAKGDLKEQSRTSGTSPSKKYPISNDESITDASREKADSLSSTSKTLSSNNSDESLNITAEEREKIENEYKNKEYIEVYDMVMNLRDAPDNEMNRARRVIGMQIMGTLEDPE